MTFREDAVEEFEELFEKYSNQIRNTSGCSYLKLLKGTENSHIFFTYSHWIDAAHLENYKNSEVFKIVWPATKKLFAERPEAWSKH